MQMLERPGALSTRYAPLDVIDEGDHYLVHVELPGFSKENVEVRINSDSMSVRAKKKGGEGRDEKELSSPRAGVFGI